MDETLPYDNYDSSSYSYSDSNYTYYNGPPSLGPESVIVPLILVIIALIAVAGNSMVVFIVLRYRKMRQSVTNFYIMNVAVGDLVFVLACVPLTAVLYADYQWKLGNFLCKSNAFLQHVTVQATCATLTVMTVDRYYVITNPFTSRQTRTILRAGVICCVVWIVSGLMHVPSALIYGTTEPGTYVYSNEHVIFCTSIHQSKRFIRLYSMYVIAVTYVVPLAIISVCYGLILAHLWKLSKGGITATSGKAANRKGQSASLAEGSSVQTATKKWKTTRIVLIVVMLFAICWAPIHALNLWNDVDPNYPHDSKSIYVFRFFCLIFAYSNSCVNPVVYALAGNSFQVYFRQICYTHPRGKQEVASTKTNYTRSLHRNGRRTSNSQTEQISMTANTSV
nr:G-protein coupled receptor 54-like [Lytechinus pictus]